jgi:LPS O-antigen subunit length determinant protein (WzzB/FepE family)
VRVLSTAGEYRQARIEQLRKASDFAKQLDIKAIMADDLGDTPLHSEPVNEP